MEAHTCHLIGIELLLYALVVEVLLMIKFIYSEKATKFCEITTLLQYIQTKVRWRFRKILWPSQNIRTLIDNTLPTRAISWN